MAVFSSKGVSGARNIRKTEKKIENDLDKIQHSLDSVYKDIVEQLNAVGDKVTLSINKWDKTVGEPPDERFEKLIKAIKDAKSEFKKIGRDLPNRRGNMRKLKEHIAGLDPCLDEITDYLRTSNITKKGLENQFTNTRLYFEQELTNNFKAQKQLVEKYRTAVTYL